MILKERICNKKTIAYIITAMMIAGLEILGEILDALMSSDNTSAVINAKNVLLWALKGAILWIVIAVSLKALWVLGNRLIKSNADGNADARERYIYQSKLRTGLIIILTWIPCFLAYFPAIYSYDGEPQLIQYITGEFDNHHPVLHTLIIGWCYDLGQWLIAHGINIDGMAFMSILQMTILAYALATVIAFLAEKKVGIWYLRISLLLFCIFPVTPVMAISTTKDTIFTAFFVLTIIRLLEKQYVLLGFDMLGCMLLRRNASYVFMIMSFVLLVMLVAQLIKSKDIKKLADKDNTYAKYLLVLLISVLAFNISEKIILSATHAVQGESAEALNVPLMQMARAYKSNQEEVTLKYGDELYRYISPDGLNNYRPLISDGVKQRFNNELFAKDKTSFVKLYVDMFLDYPVDYIQAFLYMTKGDWQLMDNSHCEVYKDWWRDRTGYLITDATPVFALGYMTKLNLLPRLRNVYEAIVTDCCYRSFFLFQIIFAPATYVILTILSGIVLLMKKNRFGLFVWGFVGLYLLTIIAGPCVLVRYIFPLMMIAPILRYLDMV